MSLCRASLNLPTERCDFILNQVAKMRCTEHHDPQNHFVTYRNEVFQVGHNNLLKFTTVFLNIITSHFSHTLFGSLLAYTFPLFVFFNKHSQFLFLFFSFYSIFFLSIYPTLTFDFSLLSHSLSKPSVNLAFYTFYCLPAFVLCSLAFSIQTFD